MASDRVETFQRQVELWNSGQFDQLLDEWGPGFSFTPDPRFPEAGKVQGEALRRWFEEWTGMWDNNELHVGEVAEHGETVLADCSWQLTVANTGAEVPTTRFSMVCWFDDDNRITEIRAFFDRDEAVAAADAPR